MSKYTSELKLEIVKEVVEKGKTAVEVAAEYYVHKSEIQKWVAAYKVQGVSGIERPKSNYTGEFKKRVVEYMRNNGLSQREMAAKYNLENHKMPDDWERIYLEQGVEGLYVERRGRACAEAGVKKGKTPKITKKTEEDLIAENQRLRMENAYLKKLNALARKKHKQRQSSGNI